MARNIGMKNQQYLNTYFSTEWKGNLPDLTLSGPALISKINDGESVIDIGCGDNYFKGKIPNLIGIDPANDAADVKLSIEDFVTDKKFDVAFCLGSINFGDYNSIKEQILLLNKLLKPLSRIYWRMNPGRQDHRTDGCKEITFFPWSKEYAEEFATLIGFTVVAFEWDTNMTNGNPNRYYSEWIRSS